MRVVGFLNEKKRPARSVAPAAAFAADFFLIFLRAWAWLGFFLLGGPDGSGRTIKTGGRVSEITDVEWFGSSGLE